MNNNRPTISATQALDEIEEQRAAAGLPPLSDCDVESLFYGTDADRAALLELLRDLAGITISGDLEPVRVTDYEAAAQLAADAALFADWFQCPSSARN